MRGKALPCLASAIALPLAFFALQRDAHAVPSFARKYQTSCQTCHTVYPMLNSFGEAFRRDGYRFPSQNGSVDSDAVKAATIAMGQEEYKKTFPDSVWPSVIVDAIPLSAMINGAVTLNFPDSDAKANAGNVFTWNGILAEGHVFGAGAFSDTVTYFTQLTFGSDGFDLETGYLLWNDILGPRHLFNVWVGRLMAPQLTSWGLHSSYLSDTYMPPISIAGLYNPTGTFTLGQGHSDGIEINGIVAHNVAYSMGWITSLAPIANGLKLPNAEELYAHVAYKLGGMSLDGEGSHGIATADAKHPWVDTSATLDLFAYHGLAIHDNGTSTPTAIAQNDSINALGGALRAQVQSINVNVGLQFEKHSAPYPGTAPTPANPPSLPNALPGAPDYTTATGVTQYGEIDYVVFPWLVPGVRTEYTNVTLGSGGNASLFRVIPGVAVALRPNIRLVVTGDFEYAHGIPPTGSWGPAAGSIVAQPREDSKFEAETLMATLAWSF